MNPLIADTTRTDRYCTLFCVGLAGLLAGAAQLSSAGVVCEDTAQQTYKACLSDMRAERALGAAICSNLSDSEAQQECQEEVDEAWNEGIEECQEQRVGRLELCSALNENRYDPDIDPAQFDATFTVQNIFFPLEVGDTREYVAIDDEGEFAEYVLVEVLNKTKAIQGLTCRVVRDIVTEACDVAPCDAIEDTDDWFAQHNSGDVYYCGELSKDFEYTDGDMPREAELVDIGGSFKGGRDGDKMGIIFKAVPMVGIVYRQEWSLGNAEDWAAILSVSYGTGDGFDADTEDPESLDYLVPQALAEYFCGNNNCVVTQDGNALEPGTVERKYHAPGIGVFLEVNLEDEEIVRLVSCHIAADQSLHDYCGGEIPEPEEP